ncbi:hypothetical protein Aperf_G00000050522 [Anoplocephala perfoliata]
MEVALSYAYTGHVRIDLHNALRIFLLALNLRCSFMMERCIDFLRTRVSRENIVDVWSVANSTSHGELISLCLPVVRTHFEDLSNSPRFCSFMEPEVLAVILADPLIEKSGSNEPIDVVNNEKQESIKVRALSTWLRRENPNETNEDRVNRFQRLLSFVDLCAISHDILISLYSNATVLKVSKVYLDLITSALRRPKHIPASPHAETYFNFHITRSSSQENQILIYGFSNTNVNECVLVNAPQILVGPDVRHVLPYRKGCSISRLQRWVCIIGGEEAVSSTSTSIFDILNLDTGRFFRGPALQEPRTDHSTVGADKNIFVFGGESGKWIISSCETYDSQTNRWTKLPNMPIARAASSAVVIPNEGILVVGGRIYGATWKLFNTNQAHILQSTGDQKWEWKNLPSMLSERIKPGIVYFKGTVFVAGGNVADHFDIEMLPMSFSNTPEPQWMFVSLMEFPPQHPYSFIVADERLFLMHGEGDVLEYTPSTASGGKASSSEIWKPFSRINHVRKPIFLAYH